MTRDELRRHYQAVRRTLPAEDRAARNARLEDALRAHPWFAEARVVAAYMAVGGEPAVHGCLDPARHVVALPRTVGAVMSLHRWEGDALEPGVFRIPEPAASCPIVPVESVDLWLVPGVAFDRRGNRLGRGAGHYDRALAEAPGRKVGIAWAAQVADTLPAAPHDIPMDALLTEEGWLVTTR